MFADRIEGKWVDAFGEVFERCAVRKGDTIIHVTGRPNGNTYTVEVDGKPAQIYYPPEEDK